MNRQMRRQMQREQEKQPTYNMTQTQVVSTAKEAINDEYEKIRQNLKEEVFETYTNIIISCFLMSLHDVYGFGNQRMDKLLDNFENTLESIIGGYVSVEDIMLQCKEEFGIDLGNRR